MNAEQLGQQLRAAREARELTLEEVEQALRIRARFLAAFEAGDYTDLPSAVQARGFLRNYARYLHLDPDAAVAEFDAALRAAGAEQGGLFRRRRSSPPPAETTIPAPVESLPGAPQQTWRGAGAARGGGLLRVIGVVALLIVVGGLCLGGVWAAEFVLNQDANRDGPDLLSILPTVPTLTPSTTFMPTATAEPGEMVAVGPPITDRVVLELNVEERTWMRVTADGAQIYAGLVRPGIALEYQAQDVLIIEASSGSALNAVFNNIPIGHLGLRGEAVSVTFTPDLALTPTPDEAPTATFTPIPPSPTPDTTLTLEAGGLDSGADAAAPAGAEGTAPTALPIPGTDTPESVPAASPTLQPPGGDAPTLAPTATPTVTVTATPPPTLTATSTPTTEPSPTAILPPRTTATPIPSK